MRPSHHKLHPASAASALHVRKQKPCTAKDGTRKNARSAKSTDLLVANLGPGIDFVVWPIQWIRARIPIVALGQTARLFRHLIVPIPGQGVALFFELANRCTCILANYNMCQAQTSRESTRGGSRPKPGPPPFLFFVCLFVFYFFTLRLF